MNIQEITLYSMEFEIPFISFLFIIMLIIVYMSKEKINSIENKIFKIMLLSSFIEILLDFYVHMLCSLNTFETITSPLYYNLFNIINKLIVINFGTIFECLFIYILVITYGKDALKSKILKSFLIIVDIILLVSLCFTNIIIVDAKTAANVIGGTPMLGYIAIALFLTLSILVTIKNYKKVDYRYLPIITIFIVLVICYLATIFLPGMILYDFAIVILCYLMYFTIENPDIKMMKELKYSKEVIERSRNDTLKVIQEMENDLEDNLEILEEFGNKKINKNNLQEVNDEINNMQKYSLQLVSKIDGLLSLAKIDSGQLEVRKDKYEISNLYEEIRTILEEIKNKYRVDYELVIDKKDNFVLYGDKEKIKGIVLHMILGIVKDNDKNKINIRINNITVGNICRLKIHIDTRGIIIDKNSFDYKIVFELENMIKGRIEEYDNEIVLISDERRMIEYNVLDKDNSLIGNTNGREYNDKRVLLVINDKKKSDKLKKVLNTYKIRVNTANDLSSMIDKIDKNKTYDMILLDDMVSTEDNNKWMEEYNSKSIYKYTNYKIPVVIMVHENKDGYEKEYMRHGFDNYLMKNIKQDDLDKILDKYLK